MHVLRSPVEPATLFGRLAFGDIPCISYTVYDQSDNKKTGNNN